MALCIELDTGFVALVGVVSFVGEGTGPRRCGSFAVAVVVTASSLNVDMDKREVVFFVLNIVDALDDLIEGNEGD